MLDNQKASRNADFLERAIWLAPHRVGCGEAVRTANTR